MLALLKDAVSSSAAPSRCRAGRRRPRCGSFAEQPSGYETRGQPPHGPSPVDGSATSFFPSFVPIMVFPGAAPLLSALRCGSAAEREGVLVGFFPPTTFNCCLYVFDKFEISSQLLIAQHSPRRLDLPYASALSGCSIP